MTILDPGANLAENDVKDSLKDLGIVQFWFADEILQTNPGSGSSAVLILPGSRGSQLTRTLTCPEAEIRHRRVESRGDIDDPTVRSTR